MASALLRMGRIKGVSRPAIATIIPVPNGSPTVLLDAGANAEVQPDWLVQFAQMGSIFSRHRFGVASPRVGLLSIGEEPGKGDELRKAAYPLLRDVEGFVGNVEGRDFLAPASVDVVVTDGFTGNVALKSLEGALRSLAGLVFGVFETSPEAKAAGEVVIPLLLASAESYDPEVTGGGVLLGVDGVCVIAHGSSSANAIVQALGIAADAVTADVPGRIREAVANAG
jgi:glycerol-3-phosphate acyltransferase PlsX